MNAWTKELDQTMDQVRDVVAARTQSAILEGIAMGTQLTFGQLAACVAASAASDIDAEFLLIDDSTEPAPEPAKPKPRARKRS